MDRWSPFTVAGFIPAGGGQNMKAGYPMSTQPVTLLYGGLSAAEVEAVADFARDKNAMLIGESQ